MHMTKLLSHILTKIQDLSPDEQNGAAELLKEYVATVEADVHLTDEQLAEVRRRRAEKKPKTLSLKQFDNRLRKLGVV